MKGTMTIELDMKMEMLDAKKMPVKFADGSDLLLCDLIFQALSDETAQPGQPPVPVSKEDKRRRWRLSVAVYSGDTLELDKSDQEYILERGDAVLSSPGFGMLEDAITAAEKAAALKEAENAGPEGTVTQLDNGGAGA